MTRLMVPELFLTAERLTPLSLANSKYDVPSTGEVTGLPFVSHNTMGYPVEAKEQEIPDAMYLSGPVYESLIVR
ncbi:MAG TPA: hypothetical protein PK761_07070, partial [Clostridia bacterium]|nr:hypothetical protein [Clostridia bacterium]